MDNARPWHAEVVMFDEEGRLAHRLIYQHFIAVSGEAGSYWLAQEPPGTMAPAEILDALERLRRTSDRMRRISHEDIYNHILYAKNIMWGLDSAYDDKAGTDRLMDVIFNGRGPQASWCFPDEIGCVASMNYAGTMALIDYLLEHRSSLPRTN